MSANENVSGLADTSRVPQGSVRRTTRTGGTSDRAGAEANEQMARRMFDLWNARDFDSQVAFASDDVETVTIPFGDTLTGPEGFRQAIESWATAFPDARVEVTRVIADDDGAVIEFTGRGTHKGPLPSPAGEIAPTGRRVELRYCQVLELDDGAIRRSRLYFDAASLLRQLGLSE